MTQAIPARLAPLAVLAVLASVTLPSLAQTGEPQSPVAGAITAGQEEDYKVYTEHPRLFLNARRLKMLRRERERTSIRWQQFETLVAGKARMNEPGMASALYYKIANSESAAKDAIQWALGPTTDLRQIAIVFDWCQDRLTEAQLKQMADKLRRLAALSKGADISSVRARTLAAVVLAGHASDDSEARIKEIVTGWWRKTIVPGLRAGKPVIPFEEVYPLFEMLHAIRDNTNIELRDEAPKYFQQLPSFHLHAHYPATYPAPENEFRIPFYTGDGEPDAYLAALSRAAEFAMVAYDTNAQENQFLQGWLIHDRFLMRGAFGIVYEFLWANPYQPGLSFYHLPVVFHDPVSGALLVRDTWEEDANWFGLVNGKAQLFKGGTRKDIKDGLDGELQLGPALILFGKNAYKFALNNEAKETVFLVGLKPGGRYDIEVDGEEMQEHKADSGGVIELQFPPSQEIGVRIKDAGK